MAEASRWRIRASRRPKTFIRYETLCASFLGIFFLALSLGPRIPLPIDVGRRVDLRIHEVLILTASLIVIYSLTYKRNPKRLVSPWSPWFLIAFLSVTLALAVKTTIAHEQLLLNLGYSFRALMFFTISVTVFVIAHNGGTSLRRFTLPLICAAFGLNAVHTIFNGVRGRNSFIEDLNGKVTEQYGPGLLGEPNGLAAGVFFVYFLVVFAQWRSGSLKAQLLLSVGVIISLTCLYLTNNRSAMVMAVVVLVLQLLSSVNRKAYPMTVFYALILALGAASFFVLNPRGSSETVGEALSGGRIPQWTRSLDLIRENPIIGWNFGSNEAHHAFLRLWGEFGAASAVLFLILLMIILWRNPRRELPVVLAAQDQTRYKTISQMSSPSDDSWLRVLKHFLAALLVGGLLTDSFTPVQNWDLLGFSVGMAWATWTGSLYGPSRVSHQATMKCKAAIEGQLKSPPK